jgi:hypothetical protein
MTHILNVGQSQPKTLNWINSLREEDHDFPILGLMHNGNSYLFPPGNVGSNLSNSQVNRMRLVLSRDQVSDYDIHLFGSAPIREATFYHQRDGYNCGPYSIMHALSIIGQSVNFSLTTENIRACANELRSGNQILLKPTEWFSFDDIRDVLRSTIQTKCKTVMSAEQKKSLDRNGNSCLSYEEAKFLLSSGGISCVIINIDNSHFYACVPTPNSRYIVLNSLQAEPEVIIADKNELINEWTLKDGRYLNKEFLAVIK